MLSTIASGFALWVGCSILGLSYSHLFTFCFGGLAIIAFQAFGFTKVAEALSEGTLHALLRKYCPDYSTMVNFLPKVIFAYINYRSQEAMNNLNQSYMTTCAAGINNVCVGNLSPSVDPATDASLRYFSNLAINKSIPPHITADMIGRCLSLNKNSIPASLIEQCFNKTSEQAHTILKEYFYNNKDKLTKLEVVREEAEEVQETEEVQEVQETKEVQKTEKVQETEEVPEEKKDVVNEKKDDMLLSYVFWIKAKGNVDAETIHSAIVNDYKLPDHVITTSFIRDSLMHNSNDDIYNTLRRIVDIPQI